MAIETAIKTRIHPKKKVYQTHAKAYVRIRSISHSQTFKIMAIILQVHEDLAARGKADRVETDPSKWVGKRPLWKGLSYLLTKEEYDSNTIDTIADAYAFIKSKKLWEGATEEIDLTAGTEV